MHAYIDVLNINNSMKSCTSMYIYVHIIIHESENDKHTKRRTKLVRYEKHNIIRSANCDGRGIRNAGKSNEKKKNEEEETYAQ